MAVTCCFQVEFCPAVFSDGEKIRVQIRSCPGPAWLHALSAVGGR